MKTLLTYIAFGGALALSVLDLSAQPVPSGPPPLPTPPPASAQRPARTGSATNQPPVAGPRASTNVTSGPSAQAAAAVPQASTNAAPSSAASAAPPPIPVVPPRSQPAQTQPAPSTPQAAQTPQPAPAQPQAADATPIVPGPGNLGGLPGGDKVPPNFISLQSTPLEQVLTLYAELTGRTVLRPNQLPQVAISLKNQTTLTKAEALQALDSVFSLNGITMINVGDKFVTAVPSAQALQEGAAFSQMSSKEIPESDQYITKMVQLKYALPSEVQPLIAQFSKVGANGILAIDSTQTLVLRDYAANIKRMLEIIEKVDVSIENDYKLEVIPIKYGKVDEIYTTMSSLIGGGGGAAGAPAAGTTSRRSSRSGARGGRTGMGMGAGMGAGMGTAGYGQQGALGLAGRQPGAVPTQPGAQNTFAQRLQGIVNRAAGGAAVQLLGDAKIVPDDRSNSLIVFANKEDMQMITNIVSKVDRLLAQVLIEAVIMDVSITDSKSLGISAVMNPKQVGKLSSVAGSNNGQSFLGDLTNLTSSLPTGFSYFAKYGGDLNAAVNALAANGRGEVLQTPRVQTSHAIPASFFTGETVPYITSTFYGGYGYGPSSSFQQLSVGIELDVTPFITPDGLVVMDIDQNIEELSGFTSIQGVGNMPNTTQRRASATVSVQDGDTIILGGYIRTSKSKNKSGVPLLMDIPLLGNLFRSTSQDNKRTELIVLLRPTVLPTPRDAAVIAKSERGRLPGVREMEKEMQDEEKVRHEKADKATGTKRSTPQP